MRNKLFHVHTFRCGHAEMVTDEAYIKKALELGFNEIYFSDHALFPGDPFGNRMAYDQLPEYLSVLGELKRKYEGQIFIHVGLEIEYLTSFQSYYEDLKVNEGLDYLLLGQHFCELPLDDGTSLDLGLNYSFQLCEEDLQNMEYFLCGMSSVQAMQTGMFDYVAHPDRVFRRRTDWGELEMGVAQQMIKAAWEKNLYLEKNLASMRKNNDYREGFWQMVPDDQPTIIGFDAHSLNDVDEGIQHLCCDEFEGPDHLNPDKASLEEFAASIQRGHDDITSDRYYTLEEAEQLLKAMFSTEE